MNVTKSGGQTRKFRQEWNRRKNLKNRRGELEEARKHKLKNKNKKETKSLKG
jgi:hypothetical protein